MREFLLILCAISVAWTSETAPAPQDPPLVSADSTPEVEIHNASDILKDPLKYVDLFTYMKSQQIFDAEDQLVEALAGEAEKGTVLAWHYSMVNDIRRNEQYLKSIEKVVNENTTVLDIGTGAGLLALISARCGAKHVYTVEFEPVLAELATKIIEDNGLSHKITVLNKLSTELVIGVDMPEKADVLVSEIVDSVLVGEHMVPSYLHAVQNLIKDDGHVMPKAGNIVLMPIESADIHHYRHVQNDKVDDFDYSYVNKVAGLSKPFSLRIKDITYRALADDQIAWHWDFLDKKGREWPAFSTAVFTATSSGRLDAVLLWFNMWLDDDIVVTTHPNIGWAHESHWVQYMFTTGGIEVEAGDEVKVLVAVHETSVSGDVLTVNDKAPVYVGMEDLPVEDTGTTQVHSEL